MVTKNHRLRLSTDSRYELPDEQYVARLHMIRRLLATLTTGLFRLDEINQFVGQNKSHTWAVEESKGLQMESPGMVGTP